MCFSTGIFFEESEDILSNCLRNLVCLQSLDNYKHCISNKLMQVYSIYAISTFRDLNKVHESSTSNYRIS